MSVLPAIVFDRNRKPVADKYWFFLCGVVPMQDIDFSKSEFTTWSNGKGYSRIEVNNDQDLAKYQFRWQLKKVTIRNQIESDLVGIKLSSRELISERLATALRDANVTGVEYQEIEVAFHS